MKQTHGGKRWKRWTAGLAAALVVVALASAPRILRSQSGWTLIGWNNLGMHCEDADFSVFAILPPYNVIDAQLIDPSGNVVTSGSGITVTYQAVADPTGSINTTSAGKTNFWQNVQSLFGVSLPVDEGLAGQFMPGTSNTPQPMKFVSSENWFEAEGIPMTPYDDSHVKNYYPLMRLTAKDASGTVLATTDIVLPVSDEMDCSACHASGSGPAAEPSAGWVNNPDPQRDYRLNILRLHDEEQAGDATYAAALAAKGYNAGGLYDTVTVDGKAILCYSCHFSNALPNTGYQGVMPLTEAMHTLHSTAVDPTNGMTLDASTNRTACYRCHPGSSTRCLRGAMGSAVGSDGSLEMQCQSCHGRISAVGAPSRQGWLDEPNCQACHTGTATNNDGQIRYTSALDASGQLRQPADTTFATNPNTPASGFSLYRFSTGHGGLQCSACHGSTHAIFPSSHGNDNIQSETLQGHKGFLAECTACHATMPSTVNGGPHGMHPVGQSWVSGHEHAVSSGGSAQCQVCHGTDYRGTVLSRSFANRTISTEFGTKNFWRGFQIGCYTCHNGPRSDSRNSNQAPVVSDLSAATTAGSSVSIPLQASDPDGNTLTLRIVSQPANGTVGLSGTTATFYPFDGFTGTDTFTYAAWDGMTDSNLGTVTVTVSGGSCTLTCSATAPASANVGDALSFFADATPGGCSGSLSYDWNFGDGTSHSSQQNPTHTYTSAGTYHWTMTASIAGVTCQKTGDITINATASCTVSCSAAVPSAGTAGSPVAFQGSATTSNCGSASIQYAWDFGDGSAASSEQSPTHTYASAGTYHWTLTASASGSTCQKSGDIVISAPASCTLSCSATVPSTGTAGGPVSFQGTATTSNCGDNGVQTVWNFGDGSDSVYTQNTSHTYASAGTYSWSFTATVQDQTCQKTGTITVSEPQIQPPAVSSVTKLGNPFRLAIQGSNFESGIKVYIGSSEDPWADVTYVSGSELVLGRGRRLKRQFPKGVAVSIRLVNPDGGSVTTSYTRGGQSLRDD